MENTKILFPPFLYIGVTLKFTWGFKIQDLVPPYLNSWRTVKVSYGTLPSFGSIINNHNSKIIGKGEAVEQQRKCSCPEIEKPACPYWMANALLPTSYPRPSGPSWRMRWST